MKTLTSIILIWVSQIGQILETQSWKNSKSDKIEKEKHHIPSIGNLILANEAKERTLIGLLKLPLLEIILKLLSYLPLKLQSDHILVHRGRWWWWGWWRRRSRRRRGRRGDGFRRKRRRGRFSKGSHRSPEWAFSLGAPYGEYSRLGGRESIIRRRWWRRWRRRSWDFDAWNWRCHTHLFGFFFFSGLFSDLLMDRIQKEREREEQNEVDCSLWVVRVIRIGECVCGWDVAMFSTEVMALRRHRWKFLFHKFGVQAPLECVYHTVQNLVFRELKGNWVEKIPVCLNWNKVRCLPLFLHCVYCFGLKHENA